MIDIGRKRDMELLMSVVNDEAEPLLRRRHAYRTAQSIRRKMADGYVLRLRLRLIAAIIANDIPQIHKLSERIEDYERHNHLNRKM